MPTLEQEAMILGMKTLLVVLTLTLVAVAEEPVRFRGVYIGEPIAELSVDCSGGKPKKLDSGYKIHGDVCSGKRGIIYRTHAKGGFWDGVKIDGDSFSIVDGKIVSIAIWVPNNDWAKVRYDLVQKLGEPATEVPDVYQNAFGAKWEYSQGFWSKGELVVTAGIKVDELAGAASRNPFTGQIETRGIQILITDAQHARLPSTRPSTID